MKIINIPAAEAERLVPLVEELHALHVIYDPQRYDAVPGSRALTDWLGTWLATPEVAAIAAESPHGGLLGYLIYEIEERPSTPLHKGEQRAVLHHIAVAKPWQRMGIGQALISEMKTRVMAQNVSIIKSSHAAFNTASAGLMQAMGLMPVGVVTEWRADT